MSTDIYHGFGYDYEAELQKKSDNFVPLGSKKPKINIRTSPIVVPAAVKTATRVSVKRAETPATTTTRKDIIQKMPIIIKQQPYDYELNRPFSPIQTTPITTKRDDDDDWSSIYDEDFRGGKKRTRKARSRSVRRKRTKRSYSRRYRSRKSR